MWKLSAVLDAINPATTCRRYDLNLMENWNSGEHHSFWLRRNALREFNASVDSGRYVWVDMTDRFSGFRMSKTD